MFWAHAVARLDGSDADGIHLLWAPPRWAGYSVGGFDIWRREARPLAPYKCYELTTGDLAALETRLRAETPPAAIALRPGPCPQPLRTLPDEPLEPARPSRPTARPSRGTRLEDLLADDRAVLAARELTRAAAMGTPPRFARRAARGDAPTSANAVNAGADADVPHVVAPPPPGTFPLLNCLVYELRFYSPVSAVRLLLVTPFAFAVALREEKVVDSAAAPSANGVTQVDFRREGIDRAMVWVGALARGIQICWVARADPQDASWERATLVATGVQLPLRELQPALAGATQEEAQARSRLLPGESLGPGQFKRLSEALTAALRHPGASPVHTARMVRETREHPFVEISPWTAGLSLAIAAEWRRGLGLGFLDPAGDLRRDATYDYRIVGRFRRRDVEEPLLGFHTIPLGTPLPRSFYLGGVRFDVSGTAEVVAHPPVPERGLEHSFRKGLQFDGRLTIGFSEPLSRIVLEVEPDAGPGLTFRAAATDVIPGLPVTVHAGDVPQNRRVELTFAHPVTRVELQGKGLLYGVRHPALASDVDPDEVVTASAYITGVRFERTSAPAAPSLLGTSNLQQPPSVGDPAVMTQRPPHFLGFRLHWLPPPASATWPPGWWPPDLPAASPSEVVGFEIERRRVDSGGAWVPFDREHDTGLDALVGASRTGRRDPESVRPGDELLEHFPEVAVPTPPVPVLAEIDDVLNARAGQAGVQPGSTFQYRIWSVDAIGRRSDTPTTGSVVRLEKRLPPPQPVGPPVPADDERPLPRGVRARLLQAADPFLSAEDSTRLAGRANAVLLEWGWTEQERRADPWAREFRVYWQPNPPDLVLGRFTGPGVRTGAVYELPATLSRSVTADQFAGQFVRAGGYPFRVASHDAGNTAMFRLEASALDLTPPPVPGPGAFQLRPVLDGAELRPPAWAERTHVEPIDHSREAYEYVLPHVLPIDADRPRARVWVGVSAADDQAYRPDELAATHPNGGRPGNESSIVPATVEARWLGRPPFTVPPPSPDVPTVVLPEVAGDEVGHDIDVPALMPGLPHAGSSRFRLERLSAADLCSLLVATPADQVELLLPAANEHGVSTSGGVARPYAIADAAHRAALVAAIRTGEPARIENRFLMDIATRFNGTTLENFWRPTGLGPMPYGPMPDRVPNKAERFLYRLRAVDAAGRTSEGVAFVPRIFRVPSPRMPAGPQLVELTPVEASVRLVVRAGDRLDVAGVLIFLHTAAWSTGRNLDWLRKAQLLRTPNRADLYPADGIRLRLVDGTLLTPVFAPLADAAAAGLVRTWDIQRTVGHRQRVAAWAAAVTRDGVPSVVAGPVTTTTPQPPPPVPALTVAATPAGDEASWAAGGADVTYRLERSLDGGATWLPASPWLAAGATGHVAPTGPAGRVYRLRVRLGGAREATGAPVAPA